MKVENCTLLQKMKISWTNEEEPYSECFPCSVFILGFIDYILLALKYEVIGFLRNFQRNISWRCCISVCVCVYLLVSTRKLRKTPRRSIVAMTNIIHLPLKQSCLSLLPAYSMDSWWRKMRWNLHAQFSYHTWILHTSSTAQEVLFVYWADRLNLSTNEAYSNLHRWVYRTGQPVYRTGQVGILRSLLPSIIFVIKVPKSIYKNIGKSEFKCRAILLHLLCMFSACTAVYSVDVNACARIWSAALRHIFSCCLWLPPSTPHSLQANCLSFYLFPTQCFSSSLSVPYCGSPAGSHSSPGC